MRESTIEVERQRVAQADQRIANARARAAQAGVVLHITTGADGKLAFTVSRWTLTRDLPDIGALERWLDQVGARS